jgi:APA family basic amino acid/polyamine antiporter
MNPEQSTAAESSVNSKPATGKLGMVACTALVIGNVIGSGVYLLPTSLAPYGGLALVGWFFTSVGAVMVALVFAELARLVPKAGGPYAYSKVAFGDFAGFLIAWGYWIGVWTSVAAVAVAMVSYLAGLIPALGSNMLLSGVVAISAMWVLTGVNLRGITRAGKLQTVTTAIKLIPLVAVGTIGLLWTRWGNFAPSLPAGQSSHLSAIASAASLTLFAFLGIESATVPARDVLNPEQTIPNATVLGTVVCAVVYVLSTIGVMGALSLKELAVSPAPFADAARVMWGDWAYPLVIIGAVVSCFGAINGFILLQGQVPMAAAQDGLFPSKFAVLSSCGVPAFGCVVSSILVTLLLVFNYAGQAAGNASLINIYNSIILLATFVTLVPYAFCAMAQLVLSVKRGPACRDKRMRASVVSIAAFVFSVVLIYGAGAETALFGFIVLLLGIPLYVWLIREQAGNGMSPENSAARQRNQRP